MLGFLKRQWESFTEKRTHQRLLESERQSARMREQQEVLRVLKDGGIPPAFDESEPGDLPFAFQRDESLVYAFYDVKYKVVLASLRREAPAPEATGLFDRRTSPENPPEMTHQGNCLTGEGGFLAVTTQRVYFCGERGGGLRFCFDGLVSVLERGSKRLVITFDDDSPASEQWLGQLAFREPDAQFAGALLKIVPRWCPKQTKPSSIGFAKAD